MIYLLTQYNFHPNTVSEWGWQPACATCIVCQARPQPHHAIDWIIIQKLFQRVILFLPAYHKSRSINICTIIMRKNINVSHRFNMGRRQKRQQHHQWQRNWGRLYIVTWSALWGVRTGVGGGNANSGCCFALEQNKWTQIELRHPHKSLFKQTF